jgi:methionyl-tRNA formyltransferase
MAMEKDTHTHTHTQQEQCRTLEEQHKLFRIANDETTDTETLLKLSQSESEIIRGAVAYNKNTPKFVIEKLLTDKSNHVRSVLRKRGINVSDNLTICVAGKNNIAVNGINLLVSEYSNYDICFIPNSTDNGIDGWQNSLKKVGNDLKIRQVSLEELYEIEELLFLSLEFSELIDTTRFKSKKLFNIHFSLLPKYKGMYTSALPLLYGEELSGVTLHKIDNGIDTGEIIEQIEFLIEPEDTARDLYFKYLNNSLLLLKNNLDKLINDDYVSSPQTANDSSYYSKKSIDYKNIKIDFFKTAFQIKNQFRAFTFREYQMPIFENWQIYKTEITTNPSKSKPGSTKFENEEFFIVSTIDYDIKLFKDYYDMLWKSCESGDYEKLEIAIGKVPNINFKNSKNWNSIIIATYNGHLKIVERLIEFGADINSKNKNGTTLLMYALSHFKRTQDSNIFELLIGLGSSSFDKDKNGISLKEYIIENECEQLLKYLN